MQIAQSPGSLPPPRFLRRRGNGRLPAPFPCYAFKSQASLNNTPHIILALLEIGAHKYRSYYLYLIIARYISFVNL